MELEYEKLKNSKSKCIGNISFKLLKKAIFSLLSIPIILVLIPLILGTIKLSALPIIGCISAITIPTILATFLIYQYNKIKNTKNGIENQILFLDQTLENERKKLEKLKAVKSKENEVTVVSVSKRVDDLKKLKKLLLLFYNYGYHQRKYQKYLEQGNIRTKLEKAYSEEELCLFEQTLESLPIINILNKKFK